MLVRPVGGIRWSRIKAGAKRRHRRNDRDQYADREQAQFDRPPAALIHQKMRK